MASITLNRLNSCEIQNIIVFTLSLILHLVSASNSGSTALQTRFSARKTQCAHNAMFCTYTYRFAALLE